MKRIVHLILHFSHNRFKRNLAKKTKIFTLLGSERNAINMKFLFTKNAKFLRNDFPFKLETLVIIKKLLMSQPGCFQ